MQATYSPEDNKLRLYSTTRLERELYERVRAAGFVYAPKQELFVAPMWTPSREDLLLELCDEIGDEDTSLVERQEQRAERFGDYSDSRKEDAENARRAVSAIADNIPFGQPILVGHHSEKHARKDAERIQNGMRRAVKLWEESKYWQDRAAGAIRHAKYKELPAVRARRIKGLEADQRKHERENKNAVAMLAVWKKCLEKEDATIQDKQAAHISNYGCHLSFSFPVAVYPRKPGQSTYEGSMSLWSALDSQIITGKQAAELAVASYPPIIAYNERWLAHLSNRLEYERAMLAASGGTAADRTKPEVGGACKAWCSWRGGYSLIQKVNKVSVTLLDNWGNGGRDFTRTIPFDKLTGLMSKADVDAAREAGRLISETPRGFFLTETVAVPKPAEPKPAEPQQEAFDAMRDSLAAGVQVVTAPQLFPTPIDLAARMVELAAIESGNEVLEPSAGTGRLLDALINPAQTDWSVASISRLVAVESNHNLANRLRTTYAVADVREGDFLERNGDLGKFDRIIMNPPFENGADIRHIQHALTFLKPGGKLVALCANGPRQNAILKPLAENSGCWENLPADTFKREGTGVNVALLLIER